MESIQSDVTRPFLRDDRLAGRTAIVTGSTSGIGEATARALASSGARVLVAGRDQDRAISVAASIRLDGGIASPLVADLGASAETVRSFAREAAEVLEGAVDILVNNAGVYPVAPTAAASDADLEAIWATNIRAPHILVSVLAPQMAERGSGAIVNIGSWMARTGVPYGAMYTASKAALEQFTRTWAAEYGPRGVRVNTVAPGATATPGNAGSEAAMTAMTSTTPAGKPARPADIAAAVRWIVGDEASFVQGALLDVDGGLSTTRFVNST